MFSCITWAVFGNPVCRILTSLIGMLDVRGRDPCPRRPSDSLAFYLFRYT